MSFFKRTTPQNNTNNAVVQRQNFAEIALRTIHDGVVITNRDGIMQYINPAAVTMLDCGSPDNAVGLDYSLLIKIETKEGRELPESENPLILSLKTGKPLDKYACCLISGNEAKRIPIAISVLPVDSSTFIITFRNISKELAEEGEQTEFISTASHEMRTPVASIEGYLSLALNPQTATIDERARTYLDSAHAAAKHLGKLFHDLLDVTKLDDGRIRPNFVPAEMVGEVKKIADDYQVRMREAGLTFEFGSKESGMTANIHHLDQLVYSFVDLDFLREIMDNLLDNAIKYTPNGGSVYVGVRGDGDRVLINVTDSGIGISSDDLQHIFQKFYRSDNSDTREIGGTGLGLYLVKQRTEAMGGKVWAESAFGDGSTFYVSLPRISGEEYEKRLIAVQNANMIAQSTAPAAAPAPDPAPVAVPTPVPAATPTTTPVVTSTPAPTPAAVPTPAPEPVLPSVQAPAPMSTPVPNPVPNPAPVTQAPISPPTPQMNEQQIITNNNINGGIPQ